MGYQKPKPIGVSAEAISVFAERIANALGLCPGAPLEPIIEQLGGKIQYLPINGDNSRKASITIEENGTFTIRLFSHIFPLQERMSIAHELGHLFLHSKFGDVSLEAFRDVSNENELVESEAHRFAYAFLMPEKKVREEVEKVGKDSLKIASIFMVPEPIAAQRIASIYK